MRIGIDARALHSPSGGISIYCRGLLDTLRARDDDHEYYLYSTRSVHYKGDRRFRIRVGTGRLAWKGNLWVQTGILDRIREDRIQVFFGPLQVLPLRLPRRVAGVVAIHDLVHILFPGSMTPLNYLVLKFLLRASVARADTVITGSAFTADLIRHRLGAVHRPIEVIHHGLPPYIGPRDRGAAFEFMQKDFGVVDPYVLYVGVVEPRKNLATLVRAFRILRKRLVRRRLKLVLAGGAGWKTKPLRRLVRSLDLEGDVLFTGWVPDEDLAYVYSGAEAFVFPSLYEGFGFPPLEAMAAGTPVICSTSSSLPEVAGDAAILVPPRDPGWLAGQMARVLGRQEVRDDLVARGFERAKAFSWGQSAQRTLDVFREAAREKRRTLVRRA